MQFPELDNTPISLAELQKQFWSSSRKHKNEIYSWIANDSDFQPKQRMDVYRTTARSAHVSTLMDAFPVCRAILGDDYFKLLAKSYFMQTPSFSEDMNKYGDSFPGHIAMLIGQRNELKDFVYLVDLARLEWEYQKAYFASDTVIFDVGGFQDKCRRFGDRTVLKQQPGINFMSSCFRVYEIWEMHRENKLEQQSVTAKARQYMCIYKKDYQVVVEKVHADVYELLIQVQQEKSLAEIANSFQDRYDLNAALTKAINNQWLVG